MRRDGSRTVELLIPLKGVSEISFRGFRSGDEEDWYDGLIAGPQGLMCRLSGLSRPVFRSLYTIDADRVMAEFLACCPVSIREDLAQGKVPNFIGPREAEPPAVAAIDPARVAAAGGSGTVLDDYLARDLTEGERAFMTPRKQGDSGTGPYLGPDPGEAGDMLPPEARVPIPGDFDGLRDLEEGAQRRTGTTGGAATFVPPEYNPQHAPPGSEHRPKPGENVFPDVPIFIDPNDPQSHGPDGHTGIDLRDGE